MSIKSQFKGVSWSKTEGCWNARISIEGVKVNLGNFAVEEAAARRYDEDAAPLGRPLNFSVVLDVNSASKGSSGELRKPTSKYTGVSWAKSRRMWEVQIRIDGKRKYLGSFDNEVSLKMHSPSPCLSVSHLYARSFF